MRRYLSFEEAVAINAEMIKMFGGVHGLRDASDTETYDWLINLMKTGRISKANIELWLRQHTRSI